MLSEIATAQKPVLLEQKVLTTEPANCASRAKQVIAGVLNASLAQRAKCRMCMDRRSALNATKVPINTQT
jgi:hypothetical protein